MNVGAGLYYIGAEPIVSYEEISRLVVLLGFRILRDRIGIFTKQVEVLNFTVLRDLLTKPKKDFVSDERVGGFVTSCTKMAVILLGDMVVLVKSGLV